MRNAALICALLVAACGGGRPDEPPANGAQQSKAGPGDAGAHPPAEPIPPGQPGGLADDRTPIPEAPSAARSAQAAAEVVQLYYALIEEGKLDEARSLWSDPAAFKAEALLLQSYSEYHALVGSPGQVEGAAGSSYVEIPVQPYGRLKTGQTFQAPSMVILSRVNDVPGSTAEQRRWRIRDIRMLPQPPREDWPPGAKRVEVSPRRPGG